MEIKPFEQSSSVPGNNTPGNAKLATAKGAAFSSLMDLIGKLMPHDMARAPEAIENNKTAERPRPANEERPAAPAHRDDEYDAAADYSPADHLNHDATPDRAYHQDEQQAPSPDQAQDAPVETGEAPIAAPAPAEAPTKKTITAGEIVAATNGKNAPAETMRPIPAQAPAAGAGQNQPQPQPQLQAESGERLGASAEAKSDKAGAQGNGFQNVKVNVEQAQAATRPQQVNSATLVQAQQSAETAKSGALPANAAQTATLATGNQANNGQPTFVGASGDAGGQKNAGQNTGNNANQGNNGQNLAQGNNGQNILFGSPSIGNKGFVGQSGRQQFHEIVATRVARAPAAVAPSGTATTPISTSVPSGLGGPQSTLASSASARSAVPQPPVHAKAVEQVAMRLSSTAQAGGGRVEIKLSPDELGKVEIKMEIGKDGMVKAMVLVERPETLDALQRDSRGLERALQEAGLRTNSDSLDFNLKGRDGTDGQDKDNQLASKDKSDGDDLDADPDNGAELAADDNADGVQDDGSLNMVA